MERENHIISQLDLAGTYISVLASQSGIKRLYMEKTISLTGEGSTYYIVEDFRLNRIISKGTDLSLAITIYNDVTVI